MDKQAISMVGTLQPTRLTRLILAHLIDAEEKAWKNGKAKANLQSFQTLATGRMQYQLCVCPYVHFFWEDDGTCGVKLKPQRKDE